MGNLGCRINGNSPVVYSASRTSGSESDNCINYTKRSTSLTQVSAFPLYSSCQCWGSFFHLIIASVSRTKKNTSLISVYDLNIRLLSSRTDSTSFALPLRWRSAIASVPDLAITSCPHFQEGKTPSRAFHR